jgi:hypothetical protein
MTKQAVLDPRAVTLEGVAAVAKQADAPYSTSPIALLQRATETGATPEMIAKWMDLQERYDAGQARKAFFTDMALFQSRCPAIPRTKTVNNKAGGKMYAYSPLETILDAIRSTEAGCGFRHSWDVEELEKGGVRVICRISHVGGHSEQSTVTMPPTQGMNTNAAQDKGIIISYGQRRSLLNAYGLATGGEDTDARDAGTADADDALISPEQAATIRSLLAAKNKTEGAFCKWREIGTVEELPASAFAEVLKALNGMAATK